MARGLVALLLETSGLADLVAEEVELGAADLAAADDLDLLDLRRVNREGTLDTHTEADLADGEGLTVRSTMTAGDDALEHLGTLASTLDDLVVDLDGIADVERRQVFTNLLQLYCADDVHVPVVPVLRWVTPYRLEAGASG